MPDLSLRLRIDFGGVCSIGFGKINLLEQIARTGSVAQAARSMQMGYRRAWQLVNSMNASFDEPVIVFGSRQRGRATLTAFGRSLIAKLRTLDAKLGPHARRHLRSIIAHVRSDRAPRTTAPLRSQKRTHV